MKKKLKHVIKTEIKILKVSLIVATLFSGVLFVFGNVFNDFFSAEKVDLMQTAKYFLMGVYSFFLIGNFLFLVTSLVQALKKAIH